jgi:hypothetical protein
MSLKKEFIFKAIEDVQETIRFLDSKAGVIVIFLSSIFIFLITKLTDQSTVEFLLSYKNMVPMGYYKFLEVIAIIIFIKLLFLILLTLRIIYPNSSPEKNIDLDFYTPKRIFFLYKLNKKKYIVPTIHEYFSIFHQMDNEDFYKELIFELQKVSYIRHNKSKGLNLVIILFGVFFTLILIYMVIFFIGFNL